jgi:maltose/moltooligosaccharide transporter
MTSDDSLNWRRIAPLLFAIQFLGWSGMFCLWIYAVPVVVRDVFHASAGGSAYRSALIAVSACFAGYALFAGLMAFLLPRAVERAGAGVVHGVALLIGGGGIAALGLIDRPAWLPFVFVAIGIGWSSLANIPYAMVGAAAPEGHVSHVMRLFGFSTIIPQVVVTLAFALFGEAWFGDAVGRVMITGGALMAAGGAVTLLYRARFAGVSLDG